MDDRCENNLKSSGRLKQEANDLTYCMQKKVKKCKKTAPNVYLFNIFCIYLQC